MGDVVYVKCSAIAHDEDCCKAETDGGCRIRAAEAMRACSRWLSVVHSAQAALIRSALTDHLPSCWGTQRYITTVRASGLPSDDACSTHCQISAWGPN
jgi:hypothetical protein